jgi:hypothetical protein
MIHPPKSTEKYIYARPPSTPRESEHIVRVLGRVRKRAHIYLESMTTPTSGPMPAAVTNHTAARIADRTRFCVPMLPMASSSRVFMKMAKWWEPVPRQIDPPRTQTI